MGVVRRAKLPWPLVRPTFGAVTSTRNWRRRGQDAWSMFGWSVGVTEPDGVEPRTAVMLWSKAAHTMTRRRRGRGWRGPACRDGRGIASAEFLSEGGGSRPVLKGSALGVAGRCRRALSRRASLCGGRRQRSALGLTTEAVEPGGDRCREVCRQIACGYEVGWPVRGWLVCVQARMYWVSAPRTAARPRARRSRDSLRSRSRTITACPNGTPSRSTRDSRLRSIGSSAASAASTTP